MLYPLGGSHSRKSVKVWLAFFLSVLFVAACSLTTQSIVRSNTPLNLPPIVRAKKQAAQALHTNLPLPVSQKSNTLIEADRYGVRKPNPQRYPNDAGYRATNPAMGYQVKFEANQIIFEDSQRGVPAWAFMMHLAAYGYQGMLKPVLPARISTDQNRITYARGDLEEWYINTPNGIEQFFTLASPPEPKGRRMLLFQIPVNGNLKPLLSPDQSHVAMYNDNGSRILTYSKLKVVDAAGKVLPPQMNVVSTGEGSAQTCIQIAVDDAQAIYPIVVDPMLSTPKLIAADETQNDYFGDSVALSGDTLAVGSWGNNHYGENSGSVYIFERNQGGTDNWGLVATLAPADGAEGDYFGDSVALSGDTLAVAAIRDGDNGFQSGSVYVFERNHGGVDNWGQTAKLVAADAAGLPWFGYSVALSGDILAVGLYHGNDNGPASGSVYIFERNQGGADNWGQIAKLIATDGAENDLFGISVAVSDSTVIVGATGDEDNGSHSGSAYVFERNRGGVENWGQTAKLIANDGAVGDDFGISLTLSADTLAVGAYRDDENGNDSGAVYIFERNQGGTDNWGQTAKLVAVDGAEDDDFGYSVTLSDDTLAVGAFGDKDNGQNSGSVYIFKRNHGSDGNWGLATKLIASDGAAFDYFGWSVAISDDTLAVGAHSDDDNGVDSGSVYILDDIPVETPGITISPMGGLSTTESGGIAVFSVALNTNPYTDVIIDLACSDNSECSLSTASLIFTRANWNLAQTVTVTGVDDAIDDGDQVYAVITAAAISSSIYNGLDPADVSLVNMDDDITNGSSNGGGGCFISALGKVDIDDGYRLIDYLLSKIDKSIQ